MKSLNSKDRVWAYILKNAYFYAEIPYTLKHFVRIFNQQELKIVSVPSEKEIKRILEVLVQEKKLIRVKNGEYMIHPSACNNRNVIFVEAFSK